MTNLAYKLDPLEHNFEDDIDSFQNIMEESEFPIFDEEKIFKYKSTPSINQTQWLPKIRIFNSFKDHKKQKIVETGEYIINKESSINDKLLRNHNSPSKKNKIWYLARSREFKQNPSIQQFNGDSAKANEKSQNNSKSKTKNKDDDEEIQNSIEFVSKKRGGRK